MGLLRVEIAGLAIALAGGCSSPAPGPADTTATGKSPAMVHSGPSLSPFEHVKQATALPGDPGRDALRRRIIASVRERLMSHRDIEQDAERMVKVIRPIVEAASRQPE